MRRLLGTKPDRLLARLWGVSPQTVMRHRRKAGIPSYRGEEDAGAVFDAVCEELLATVGERSAAFRWLTRRLAALQ